MCSGRGLRYHASVRGKGVSMRGNLLASAVLALAVQAAAAQPVQPPASGDEAEKQLVNTLMQHTQMVTVSGVTSAEGFVADSDPDTMQIVFLEGPEAGPSHISDDGEVVFLNGGSINEQSWLITQAFEKKAKLILAKEKK
jgi:hypothetical protein